MSHARAAAKESSASVSPKSETEEGSDRGSSASGTRGPGLLQTGGTAVGLGASTRDTPEVRDIQPKLTVNEPGDKYEKEAERVADAVMRMADSGSKVDTQKEVPSGHIQRMCPRCQRRYQQGKPLNCEECEAELQRRRDGRDGDAKISEGVEQAAAVASEFGKPLSEGLRSLFENRLDRDFSGVRIHTGERADRAARAINARAFTYGTDIVFRKGEYSPSTYSGKRLLAHELTHVVQQNGGRVSTQKYDDASGTVQLQESDRHRSESASEAPNRGDSPLAYQRESRFDVSVQNMATIYFPTDKSELDENDRRVVRKVAEYVRTAALNTRVEVEFHGYADERGEKGYNQMLSKERAQSVKELLLTLIAGAPGALRNVFLGEPTGHGEEEGETPGDSAEELARYRRVDVKVWPPGLSQPPESEPEPESKPPPCPDVPEGAHPRDPSNQPGEAYPQQDLRSESLCRGACGANCPDTCNNNITHCVCITNEAGKHYTCRYPALECPTHQGCREHDECYDRCVEEGETEMCPRTTLAGYVAGTVERDEVDNCHCLCDFDCIDQHGWNTCLQWADGEGPTDGQRVFFTGDPDRTGPLSECPRACEEQGN